MAVTCHVMPEKEGACDRLRRVSFSSDLVKLVHARAQAVNGEATRLEVLGASSHAPGNFGVSGVTFDELTKKKETVRSLDRRGRARISLFNIMQVLWLAQKYSYFAVYRHTVQFSSVHGNYNDLELPVQLFFPWLFFNYINKSMQELGEQLHDYTCYTSIIN